jgi:hypothetical protein
VDSRELARDVALSWMLPRHNSGLGSRAAHPAAGVGSSAARPAPEPAGSRDVPAGQLGSGSPLGWKFSRRPAGQAGRHPPRCDERKGETCAWMRRALALAMIASIAAHSGSSDAPRPGRKVRWGIMGTGAIAADFTRVLSQLPDVEVAALGSRSAERAMEFAHELGIDPGVTTLHSSYDDLVADDSIDIVYVATPSLRHVRACS